MKRIFILAFFAVLLSLSPLAQAQDKDDAKGKEDAAKNLVQENAWRRDLFYVALDTAVDKGGPEEALTTLKDGLQTGGANEMNVGIQWLTDNAFGQQDSAKFNALYFMILSDLKVNQSQIAQQLGKSAEYKDDTDTALRALMAYDLLATADAERCDDPSVTDVVVKSVGPRYKDLKAAIKAMPKEQFDQDGLDAVDTESSKSGRPVNALLCMKGDKALTTSGYQAPVPDEAANKTWSAKRYQLRTEYKNSWSDMYYKMKKAP